MSMYLSETCMDVPQRLSVGTLESRQFPCLLETTEDDSRIPSLVIDRSHGEDKRFVNQAMAAR